MSPTAEVRCRAVVSGLVQGVFFRRFVLEEARALGVRGEVWNRPDGRVELVAEGDRAALERLVDRLQEGPPAARVSAVEPSWEAAVGGYRGFSVTSR